MRLLILQTSTSSRGDRRNASRQSPTQERCAVAKLCEEQVYPGIFPQEFRRRVSVLVSEHASQDRVDNNDRAPDSIGIQIQRPEPFLRHSPSLRLRFQPPSHRALFLLRGVGSALLSSRDLQLALAINLSRAPERLPKQRYTVIRVWGASSNRGRVDVESDDLWPKAP